MSLGSIGFSLLCVAWCSCAAVSSNNGSASQILTTVFVNTNGGMAQVPTVVSVTNNTVSQIPIVVTGNHTSGTVHQSPSAYMSIIQNFLQSTKFGKQIQQEISTFLQASNVTLPLPIMNQANLLKVIGNFLPKLGSNGTLSLKDLLTNNGSDSLQHLLENLGKMGTSSLYHSLQASVGAVLGRLSLQCMGHLTQLTGDTKTALSMFDATGKIPSGLLAGNTKWTGSFDECVAIKGAGPNPLVGKYCTASINLSQLLSRFLSGYPVSADLGVCVPDTCSEKDVKLLINALFGLVPFGEVKLQTSRVACQNRDGPEYDSLAIAAITVASVIGLLMLIGTLYDVIRTLWEQRDSVDPMAVKGSPIINGYEPSSDRTPAVTVQTRPGILVRLILSFSVYTNGRKLLSTDQAGGALGCVNGIRFLSISWVVLGHSFVFFLGSGMSNTFTFIPEFMHRWTAGVLLNGLLSVDSFFTLSGLLLSYLFMKEMKREKGRINWFMFYFHRFWRLTPLYMLVMLMEIALMRYIGDGPFWKKDGIEADFCEKTWWRNLVYVNNFIDAGKSCMLWSWYLANDMQFYWVSPLMLVPLYFSRRIGAVVCALFLVGTTVTAFVVSYQLHLPATQYSLDPAVSANGGDWFVYYYVRPYCRMGPYIIGIVTGYTLYWTKGKYRISKGQNVFVWLAMTAMALMVVYGIYGPVTGTGWDNTINALYNATHRTVWAMCVAWVIFACVTGNGGFVNTLLSWKPFVPLGRLSYAVYLVHPLVQFYYASTLRTTFHGSNFAYIYIFLGSLVLSNMVAFVTSLAFEAPMMALEKVIFKRGK